LPEARQKQGRPSNINEGMRVLLNYHVEKRKQQGATVREAVSDFLEIMRRGGKALHDAREMPLLSDKACEAAYYRHRGKPNSHPNF
jgi:hypothetical protein